MVKTIDLWNVSGMLWEAACNEGASPELCMTALEKLKELDEENDRIRAMWASLLDKGLPAKELDWKPFSTAPRDRYFLAVEGGQPDELPSVIFWDTERETWEWGEEGLKQWAKPASEMTWTLWCDWPEVGA